LSALSSDESASLKRLREFAHKSTLRPDCKAQALIDWLKKTLRPSNRWNDERVIIFTEYRATQKWLFDLLAPEGLAADGRLEMIYGGMPSDQRERIKAAFQTHPNESVVRSLQPLRSAEDWWTIALGSGLRWTIDQMGPQAAARMRADNLDWLRANKISSVETNAIYAISNKPA